MKLKNVFKTKTVVLLVSVFCAALITIPFLFAADQYEYDSLGRLKKVTHSDGTVIQYRYDKTGNRIAGTPAGETVSSQNTPPYLPEAVCPGNGDIGVLNPVFSWKGGDPEGASETVKYSLYLQQNTCSNCSYSGCTATLDNCIASISAAGNVGQITYTWNQTLDPGTCYYWKVVPEDSKGAKPSNPVDVWSFTTYSCS